MPKTIVHTINARGNVMLEVTRDYFKLSPQQMHREIQAMLRDMSAALASKGMGLALSSVRYRARRQVLLLAHHGLFNAR